MLKGQFITEAVPEFTPLFMQAEDKAGTQVSGDITLIRGGKTYVLHVRVVVERILESIEGYIVTFDDIT